MPRLNEILRRPLEFLRRVMAGHPFRREEPIVKIFYPEVVDRVKIAAGYDEFGIGPPQVKETTVKVPFPEKALVIRGQLQLSTESPSHVKTQISPSKQVHMILIPVDQHPKAFPPYGVLERFFGLRFRLSGDPRIADAIYRAVIEHAAAVENNERAVPHRVETHLVHYVEHPDRVVIHGKPLPGTRPGILVILHLEPGATDEELRAQMVGFLRRLHRYLSSLTER